MATMPRARAPSGPEIRAGTGGGTCGATGMPAGGAEGTAADVGAVGAPAV